MSYPTTIVTPAQAGIQSGQRSACSSIVALNEVTQHAEC